MICVVIFCVVVERLDEPTDQASQALQSPTVEMHIAIYMKEERLTGLKVRPEVDWVVLEAALFKQMMERKVAWPRISIKSFDSEEIRFQVTLRRFLPEDNLVLEDLRKEGPYWWQRVLGTSTPFWFDISPTAPMEPHPAVLDMESEEEVDPEAIPTDTPSSLSVLNQGST